MTEDCLLFEKANNTEMKKIIYILLAGVFLFSCSDDDTITTTSSASRVEWVRTFGGTKNESAASVVATSDGGYAVFGYAQSADGDVTTNTTEGYDCWLLKFDANDALEWSNTYGGSLDDRGSEIIQTNDDGFAIVGYSKSNDEDVSENFGFHDLWIVKLTATGLISWEKSLGYAGTDKAFSIIQTTDGGFFIAGVLDVTASGGAGNSRAVQHAGGDYWAVKLDASGNIQWTKYFGGNFTEEPNDIIETADGGFIIVGASDSVDIDITNNKGQYDYWIVKINALGTLVWEKSFGGTGVDEAHSIVATNDGNYYILGETRSDDVDVSNHIGDADLWLIQIDTNGNLLSEKTFGGSHFDVGRSIKKTTDGGFLFVGSTRSQNGDVSGNNGQNDAWVAKISNSGTIEWSETVGGSVSDFAYDVAELSNQKIIAVGETASNNFDITTQKGLLDVLIIKLQ